MHSFREFLTELSNSTLASYTRKSKDELRNSEGGKYGRDYVVGRKSRILFKKRTKGVNQAVQKLRGRYQPWNDLKEDAAVNAAGSGGVAGIGVGPKGEPGIQKKARTKMLTRLLPKKILKTAVTESIESGPGELRVETPVTRSKFAGKDVFHVPSEYFHKARLGKAKYAHYRHYVGSDEVGQTIRQFGNRHYGKPIIIQDQATQHMLYLRYGKGR